MRFLFSISLFSILSFAEVPSRPPAMVVVGKKGIAESVEAKELVETSSKVRPELRIVFFDSDLAPTENIPILFGPRV